MKKIIRALYFDVKNNRQPEFVEIDVSTNDDLYRLIQCDAIDIPSRKFGGKTFSVVCDDEALIKNEEPILSVYSDNVYKRIFGNVIIANQDGEELSSLSVVDYKRILTRLTTLTTNKRRYCLCVDRNV